MIGLPVGGSRNEAHGDGDGEGFHRTPSAILKLLNHLHVLFIQNVKFKSHEQVKKKKKNQSLTQLDPGP